MDHVLVHVTAHSHKLLNSEEGINWVLVNRVFSIIKREGVDRVFVTWLSGEVSGMEVTASETNEGPLEGVEVERIFFGEESRTDILFERTTNERLLRLFFS